MIKKWKFKKFANREKLGILTLKLKVHDSPDDAAT